MNNAVILKVTAVRRILNEHVHRNNTYVAISNLLPGTIYTHTFKIQIRQSHRSYALGGRKSAFK